MRRYWVVMEEVVDGLRVVNLLFGVSEVTRLEELVITLEGTHR